ncbi:MAG: LysR family transcriptional regulator [Ectothiorhodospiraceae bacterium]|nr:LysR family transcriptional regulator [Ectothiorhodospiraceae bacterium]
MEISQIRYFVALVETGSMTKAAQRLYVTQPAVSAAVHRLEDELGVTLVERQGRGVRITIEGTQFYRRARNIINEYRAAKAETRPYSKGKPIRIGCLSTFPVHGLSSFLSRLGDVTPDHVVEFSEGSPVVLDEWLRRERIDVALTDLTHHKQPDRTRALLKDPFVVAVSPDHPFASRASLHLADLHGQPFVLRTNCELLPESNQVFKGKGVRPHIVARTARESLALDLVIAGIGLTLLPASLACERVTRIPVEDFERNRQLGLRWSTTLDASSLELLLDALEDVHWSGRKTPVLRESS